MNLFEVVRRPLITEKATNMKEDHGTICFEVHVEATKTQIANAVQKLFNVKVAEVRTINNVGKLRRKGRFAGYRSDWKKAYVRLAAGEKTPEFAEI